MDDLAGLVLQQLQIADATSPYALLYLDQHGYRALVAKVARVDGRMLFEYAYVDMLDQPDLHQPALPGHAQRSWEFVAFANKDAAVYFGLAFLNKDRVPTGEGCVMYTMRSEDVEELFERTDTGALVAAKYKDGFHDVFAAARCVGKRTIFNEALLSAGLASLMTVERVSA